MPTPMAAALTTTGLSEGEAASRLQRDGLNQLPAARPRTVLAIALEVVREPMFVLLIATGAIYLLLGDAEEAVAHALAGGTTDPFGARRVGE